MTAHTRIRHARGLSARLWRALRLRRWMTTESLVEISGGVGVSLAVEARRYLSALSRAGIVCRRRVGNKAIWMLLRDLGPQAPTHRRCAGVLYDHNTGQELPCGNNSKNPLDDTNAVRKIESIAYVLKRRLGGDGQVRMLKKEAQAFIANLDSCAEQAKALECVPLAPNARREADHEGTVDAFRRAGCL